MLEHIIYFGLLVIALLLCVLVAATLSKILILAITAFVIIFLSEVLFV